MITFILPATVCGVYHLMLGEKVRYVGQTTNIYSRIGHWRTSRFPLCAFDRVQLFPCSPEELDHLELEHIQRYQPELNSEGIGKPYHSPAFIQDRTGVHQQAWGKALESHREQPA